LDVLKEAKRILIPDGKLVLGLVLKESPWGQFYEQEKNRATVSINALLFTGTMRFKTAGANQLCN